MDNGWENKLMTYAVVAILFMVLMALLSQQPVDQSQDSYNYQFHYETHETNVNICGICLDTRP